jgi:hypothetical protein
MNKYFVLYKREDQTFHCDYLGEAETRVKAVQLCTGFFMTNGIYNNQFFALLDVEQYAGLRKSLETASDKLAISVLKPQQS